MITTQPRSLPSTPWSSQTSFAFPPRPLPAPPVPRNVSTPPGSRFERTGAYASPTYYGTARVADPTRTAPAAIHQTSHPRPLPRPGESSLIRSKSASDASELASSSSPSSSSSSSSSSRPRTPGDLLMKHRPTRSAQASYPSTRRLVVLNPDPTDDSDESERKTAHPEVNTSRKPRHEDRDPTPFTAVDNVRSGAFVEAKWYTEKNGKRVTQRDYGIVLFKLRRL